MRFASGGGPRFQDASRPQQGSGKSEPRSRKRRGEISVVPTSQRLKVPIHLRGRLSLVEEAAELASSQPWGDIRGMGNRLESRLRPH